MKVHIEAMQSSDWPVVKQIYQEGIDTGEATFETETPEWESWDKAHLQEGRVIARFKEQVVGWAALSPVSNRCVYQGVAEVSVYVASKARGQGVGKALLETLVARSEEAGLWTLQASMFPENKASLAMHLACGFRQVGRRERIGKQHGRWRDTLLMERRSPRF